MKGRTTLVITHRLSTIQKMDRIIVLDNGHIIEQGSHSDLLKHGGTYAELWAHQSGGFIEE
jgi:ABC-type multidrug transport system fused ATPase/permease subunit